MKKASKIIAALLGMMLALVLFISVMPETVSAEETETVQVGDWSYTIENGTAYISKYNGTATDVTIPTTVTINGTKYRIKTVGASAFEGNKKIKNVVIPSGISTLGNGAFKDCTELLSVTIEGNLNNADYRSAEYNYSTSYSYKYSVFYNAGNSSKGFTVTFTDGVTTIPTYMFATNWGEEENVNCHITKLVVADTVTNIGKYAFYNCKDLVDVQFGKGIKTIGEYSFYGCEKIKSLLFDEQLTAIESSAFAGCYALESVNFQNNLNTIGSDAFYGNINLTEVRFPDSLTKIYARAFKQCTGLKKVILPQNNKLRIYYEAFENTTALNEIYFNGNYSIESSYNTYAAFKNAGANENSLVVTFSEDVTSIPAYTFYSNDTDKPCCITKVIIPYTIKEVGKYAFYNCSELSEVVMDAKLDSVGQSAFYGTNSLKSIYLYNSTCKIYDDEYTFDAATTIYGPKNSTAQTYAEKYNRKFAEVNVTSDMVTTDGIYVASLDRNGILAGLVASTHEEGTELQYRWTAYNKSTNETILVQDWTDNNQWVNWKPATFGEYVLTGEARVKYNLVSQSKESTDAFEYNPYIKGKCQLPYSMVAPGQPGYLIGVETFENPNQEYQYEMLILDCTSMAWVYTTNKFTVSEGAAGWCVWQPEYGYYWTLFRVYDKAGNMIDQACYPFVNAY